MVKRLEIGPSTSVYLVLEFSTTVLNKNAGPLLLHIKFRPINVFIVLDHKELHVFVHSTDGKYKPMCLAMTPNYMIVKLKNDLDNSVYSDITVQDMFGKVLGCCASCDVMFAVHTLTREQRAVKINKRSTNVKFCEHVEYALRIMYNISHRNIVHTFHIFDLKKTIYTVMQYFPGGDMFNFVAQHQRLTENQGS